MVRKEDRERGTSAAEAAEFEDFNVVTEATTHKTSPALRRL
jgi:hypothetical protein